MSQLSERGRQLLGRYKTAESLADEEKARLLAIVEQRAARGDLPRFTVDPSPPLLPRTSALGRIQATAIGKAGLLLGVAAAGGYLAFRGAPWAGREGAASAAPREIIASQAPRYPPSLASSPVTDPSKTLPSKPQEHGAHEVPRHVTPASEDTIDAEMAVLNAAQAALKSGDAQRSLQLLDEYATHASSGKLADARSITHMQALCKLGRTTQARQEAQHFLARYPNSLYAERVKGICTSP